MNLEQASQSFKSIFEYYPGFWCVAGGWAIDFYLGRQTREHEDLEVVALREEQAALFTHLKSHKPQKIFSGDPPKFISWHGEEIPPEEIQLRLGSMPDRPDFDILLTPSENGMWICRRDDTIRLPLSQIFQKTKEGIPYLVPEIVLLFKAKYAEEKDQHDFDQTIHNLDNPAKVWLRNSLRKIHSDHNWLKALEK